MKAGQKLIGKNGKEVLLFPLEYLYLSQGEGGDYSHLGTLAMDFLGWGPSGRIYRCPYYAPCSCKCIGTTESANRIWQSLDEVNLADGTTSIVCWVQAHDNFPLSVGTVLSQGDLLGHTGTAGNVTGDHVHFNFAKGAYANWEQVPPNNNWQLRNSIHIYNTCCANDTIIARGLDYPWKEYTGGVTPTPTSKKTKKFPWVLYSKKLRESRII